METDYYDLFLDQFKTHDYRSLGWKTKKDQLTRFQKIFEIGLKAGDSILDVGSGFADFYRFIEDKIGNITYTGVESKNVFCSVSVDRYSNFDNFKIIEGKFQELNFKNSKFDWVVASGLFPFNSRDYYFEMERTITKMFGLCNKGVAFNLLSGSEVHDNNSLRYNESSFIFQRMKKISQRVDIVEGYLEDDMTLYLFK